MVCFVEMAETHIKKFEGVQWPCLRVSWALIQSTHTGTVEVLSGVPPMDLSFLYLNQKFLVYSYARNGKALRSRIKTLGDLGSDKNMKGYRFQALLCVPEVVNDMPTGRKSHLV
jgi:hypothetical protein